MEDQRESDADVHPGRWNLLRIRGRCRLVRMARPQPLDGSRHLPLDIPEREAGARLLERQEDDGHARDHRTGAAADGS